MLYPRCAPGADGDVRRGGRLSTRSTASSRCGATTQAPHAHRTRVRARRRAARAQDPRDLAATSAAASATRSPIYPGYVCSVVGSIVTGRPVKWMEDRSENLMRTGFARDYVMRGRDRGDEGRQDPRRPRGRDRRPRRVQRHRAADEVPGRLLPRVHRAPTTSRPRTARSRASTRTRRPAAWRTRARSGSPRPCTSSSAWSTCSPHELGHGPGGAAAEEPASARSSSRTRTRPAGTYDSGDYETALRKALEMAGYDELRREQAEKRERGELMGIGVVVLHRGRRRRPAQAHGHPRPGHGRRRRAARAPDRQGGARHQRADPGPGPRDDVRPDRRRGARHPARGHRGRARRHRPHAVRARHLRQPLDAGVRRGDRDGRPQGARQGAAGRRGDARGVARRPRVGEGPLVREGRPRAGRDDPGDRDGRARHGRAARGRRGRPRRRDGLQPAEPDVPVRRLHLRRRHRPGHRRRSRCGASSRSTTAARASTR